MNILHVKSIKLTPYRSKSECAALTSSFDMDNSDGKASLKRQKSPETTTDTQGMSKFY